MLAFASPVWAIVFGVAAVVLIGIIVVARSRKGEAAGGASPAEPAMPEAEGEEEETVT